MQTGIAWFRTIEDRDVALKGLTGHPNAPSVIAVGELSLFTKASTLTPQLPAIVYKYRSGEDTILFTLLGSSGCSKV